MAVAMIMNNPRGSQELYERLTALLEADGPFGGILHVAGPRPEGGWRVLEVWETREEAETFLRERLAPALEALGVTGPVPPVEFWPVHRLAAAAPV